MTRKEEVGAKIRAARETKGMLQRELGELCGYDAQHAQVYVAIWERGGRPVPRALIRRVAEALDLPMEDLL